MPLLELIDKRIMYHLSNFRKDPGLNIGSVAFPPKQTKVQKMTENLKFIKVYFQFLKWSSMYLSCLQQCKSLFWNQFHTSLLISFHNINKTINSDQHLFSIRYFFKKIEYCPKICNSSCIKPHFRRTQKLFLASSTGLSLSFSEIP